jgi:hypothetical protein
MNIRRFLNWRFIIPAAIVGFAVFVAIGGAVIVWLWNWLLPPLFGFPAITFWQGLGLLLLCRILFGGFSVGGPGRGKHMTSEERARFRERMHERFGSPQSENRQ